MILQKIKENSLIVWNESKRNNNQFACGTILPGFQTFSQEKHGNGEYYLTIYSFDVMDKSENVIVLGKTKVSAPLRSMAWSTFKENSTYPYGIICTGMADGSFCLFDVSAIISYTKHSGGDIGMEIGLIFQDTSSYDTAVNSVEVNPFKPNLFALGANDVLIMDLEEDISAPQIYAPSQENPHDGSLISSISWNKQVSHILASASRNGLTTVWDLKNNQSIFNFQESSGEYEGNVILEWNPELPTQIGVAYDDEKNPEVQIWDLRQPQGPVIVLEQGHNMGICSLSWSSVDPSLILSGGLDKKVVCWNYQTQVIYDEFQTEDVPVNLRWSTIPSVFSITHSHTQAQIKTINSEVLSNYAPRWIKPPVGARFSPSGQLVSFSEKQGGKLTCYRINNHEMAKGRDNKEIQGLLKQLKQCIEQEDILAYSEQRKQASISSGDAVQSQFWSVLHALAKRPLSLNQLSMKNPKDASRQFISEMLQSIGFELKDIIKKTEEYTGQTQFFFTQEEEKQTTKPGVKQPNMQMKQAFSGLDNPENFFQNLAQKKDNPPLAPVPAKKTKDLQNSSQEQKQPEDPVIVEERISRNTNWNAGNECIIKENLIIGNVEGAIDCALQCGRNAEALMMAYAEGKDVFESTMQTLFTSYTGDSYIKNVIRPFVEKQIDKIVKNYDLKNWKECAGMVLCKVATFNEFQDLMSLLAERFLSEKNNDESAYLLCLMMSDSIEGVAGFFQQKMEALKINSAARKIQVLKVLEKLIAFERIEHRNQQVNYSCFKSFIYQAAQSALSCNNLSTAFLILNEDRSNDIHLALLKERLFKINQVELHHQFDSPPFPLKVINIPTASSGQQGGGGDVRQNQQNNSRQKQGKNNNSQTGNTNSPTTRPVYKDQDQSGGHHSNLLQPQGENTINSSTNVQTQQKSFANNLGQFPTPTPPTPPTFHPTISPSPYHSNAPPPPPPPTPPVPHPQPNIRPPIFTPSNNPNSGGSNYNMPPPMPPNKGSNFPPPVPITPNPVYRPNNNNMTLAPPVPQVNNVPTPGGPPSVPKVGLGAPIGGNSQFIPTTNPSLRSTIQYPAPKATINYAPSSETVELIKSTLNKFVTIIDQIEKNSHRREEHQNGLKGVFTMIDNHLVSEPAVNSLVNICQFLESDDLTNANKEFLILNNIDFQKNQTWLVPLKRLIVRR